MTLEKISNLVEGKLLCGDANAEVAHFYAGDFLSNVMASAPPNCAWLTIMNNINVVGVAVIADIRAVIICEKVEPLVELVAKCQNESIALIASPLTVYDCCSKIARA